MRRNDEIIKPLQLKTFDRKDGDDCEYVDNQGLANAPIGLFRGLDIPFHRSTQLSPVHALDTQLLKNLRLHGHFGPKPIANYMPPKGSYNAENSHFAQDATAFLLKSLFPSSAGLVVNSHRSHKHNRYLLPGNIAEIFVAINTYGFYELEKEEMFFAGIKANAAVVKLLSALLPDHLKIRMNQLVCHPLKTTVVNQDKNTISFLMEFSNLLLTAFKDTVGDNAKLNGYPPYIVEKILLTYMWEMYKANTEDLKPYYDVLAQARLIDMADIKWNDAYYESDSGVTILENDILSKIRDAHYKECFPEGVQYGTSHILINGKEEPFSDCGDTVINDLFMMFLFNGKKFDVSKLLKLEADGFGFKVSKDLIRYFTEVCDCPAAAKMPGAREAWSKVVNRLNKEDDKFKIRYIKPDKENGYYGIGAGLDNMLRVIGKLLGAPADIFDMEMKDKFSCVKNLDTLCYLFSDVKDKENPHYQDRYWSVKSTRYLNHCSFEAGELFEAVPSTGWVDLTLVFSYGGSKDFSKQKKYNKVQSRKKFLELQFDIAKRKKWFNVSQHRRKVFELHFDQMHFDFNRLRFDSELYCIKRAVRSLEDIYSCAMDTVPQRISVLEKMLQYRATTNPNEFSLTLNRWLEPAGTQFLGWHNREINSRVVRVLLFYLNVKDILNRGITALSSALVFYLTQMNRLQDLQLVIATDLANQHQQSDFSSKSGILSEVLLCGNEDQLMTLIQAGADKYIKTVAGETLLHLAVSAGNERLTNSLVHLIGQDLYARTSEGYTPLHLAAKANNVTIVECLLKYGANTAIEAHDGSTPLFLIAERIDAQIAKSSHIRQLRFFRAKDNSYILERIFEVLIQYGTKFKTEYKNGMTYLQWAEANKLESIVKVMTDMTVSPSPNFIPQ